MRYHRISERSFKAICSTLVYPPPEEFDSSAHSANRVNQTKTEEFYSFSRKIFKEPVCIGRCLSIQTLLKHE